MIVCEYGPFFGGGASTLPFSNTLNLTFTPNPCQAEGGGIFDVLSDEEDLWMVEPSGLSAHASPAQARGWAAHGDRGRPARGPSPEVVRRVRWVCAATQGLQPIVCGHELWRIH